MGLAQASGAERRAEADSRRRLSRDQDDAGGLFAGRSADPLFLIEHAVADGQRREELDADESRPDAQDVERARKRRQLRAASKGDAARSDLRAGAVAAGHQSHLGWNG